MEEIKICFEHTYIITLSVIPQDMLRLSTRKGTGVVRSCLLSLYKRRYRQVHNREYLVGLPCGIHVYWYGTRIAYSYCLLK